MIGDPSKRRVSARSRVPTMRSLVVVAQVVLLVLSAMGPALVRAEEAAVESAPPAAAQEPAGTDEPASTEGPIATEEPAATQEPAAQPTPESSPEPTPEPSPEPTPEPSPAPTPESSPEPVPPAACEATGEELVWTGRDNYQAGETAAIRGNGYAADCEVDVVVERPDGVTERFSVTTAADGRLLLNYELPPPPGVLGEYFVHVLGAGSAVLASTNFYDAPAPDFDIAPNHAPVGGAGVVFTALVRNTASSSSDTARCVRVILPSGYTVTSWSRVIAAEASTGPWNDSSGTNFVQIRTAGTGIFGATLASNNWVRFDITATTPASGTATWTARMISTNADCASGGSSDELGVRIAGTFTRNYTADFRDTSNNVIAAPSVNANATQDFRIRITETAGSFNLAHAAIALPTCLTNITNISTTDSGTPSFGAHLSDNVFRLVTSSSSPSFSGTPISSGTNGDWVQVHFTATASCGAGAQAFRTAAWVNSSPQTGEGDIYKGGILPPLTVTAATADLSITKADTPDPVTAGEHLTYTIVVSNAGPATAQSVSLTDNLPAQLQNATYCIGAACDPSTGSAWSSPLALGTLAAGASATVKIRAQVNPSTPAGTDSISNTASVTTTTPEVPVTEGGAANSATAVTSVTTRADVSVTKDDSDGDENAQGFVAASVIAGNNLTYSISVTNGGPSDAQNVTLSDTVPTGTTFVSLTKPASWNCTTPLVGTTGTVNCSISVLAAGVTANFTLVVKVASSVPDGDILSNTATGSTATTDPVSGNNSDTETTNVEAEADLAASKDDGDGDEDAQGFEPATAVAGSTLTYSIAVTNGGPSDAQNVELSDTLPTGTTFASLDQDSGPTFSCTTPAVGQAGDIECTIATLAAGASAAFTVEVNVDSTLEDGDTLENTASAATDTTDPEADNNSDSEATTVVREADLSIAKVDEWTEGDPPVAVDHDPVVAGVGGQYLLTVTNNGPSSSSGFTITDTLPADFTFNATGSDNACSKTGTTLDGRDMLSCTRSTDLADGAGASFLIAYDAAATIADSATRTNEASVAGVDTDPGSLNNSDSEETTVVREADLGMAKSADPDPVVAGTSLTYTLTVTNHGPSNSSGFSITDTLSDDVQFVSADTGCSFNSDANLDGYGGSVTCTNASDLAVGALNAVSFDIVVLVRSTLAPTDSGVTGDGVANSASVTGDDDEPAGATNSNSAAIETEVVREADLGLTKTDSPDPVKAGEKITYSLTVTNYGPSSSSGFSVVDTLSANVAFVAAESSTECLLSGADVNGFGGTVTCSWSTEVAVTGSQGFTIVVLTKSSLPATSSAVEGDGVANSATVTGVDDEPDGATNANTADTETDVVRESDLDLLKEGPDGVLAGGEVVYTITISNLGPSDSDATTLTDAVPSPPLTNVKYCAYDPDVDVTCTATTPWPGSLAIPAIPATEAYVVIITGFVPETANNQVMSNTASIPCAAIDPDCDNNTDTVVTVVTARPILLVIDEDSIDNGMRFSASPTMSIHDVGQDITSGTTTRFGTLDVNDDRAGYTQRNVLRYFNANVGRYITVMTGQTGDEGWFAPNSAPTSWGATGATLQQRIANYFGLNGASSIPSQSRLGQVPDVRPLRAKGLHLLEGQTVCAVVYDSDISVNYGSRSPRISGNLSGEVLGVISFTVDVNGVHRLKGFSSSTLPEVRLRIEDAAATCQAFRFFTDAPAPSSSSVPNDVDPHVAPSARSYPAP